jgi:hypothetical protein
MVYKPPITDQTTVARRVPIIVFVLPLINIKSTLSIKHRGIYFYPFSIGFSLALPSDALFTGSCQAQELLVFRISFMPTS